VHNVELRGADLVCYSNKTESVGLRKCPYDHQLTKKAFLSDITVTDISRSFTDKMGRKPAGIDMERNCVIVTLCIPTFSLSQVYSAWTRLSHAKAVSPRPITVIVLQNITMEN